MKAKTPLLKINLKVEQLNSISSVELLLFSGLLLAKCVIFA